jgi:hypothetical protein
MTTRDKVRAAISQKGPASVFQNVQSTVRDLKQAQYTRAEIKETIREHFYGIEGHLDRFISEMGY